MKSTQLLEKQGVQYRLIELNHAAVTVRDVVEYSKTPINPGEICKTIILRDKTGGFKAVLLRGADRVDLKKAERQIGASRVASLREVKRVTGVEPGAVCPLLLDVPVYVDEAVLRLDYVNFSSGEPMYGIEIRAVDLQRVLEYCTVDVAAVL